MNITALDLYQFAQNHLQIMNIKYQAKIYTYNRSFVLFQDSPDLKNSLPFTQKSAPIHNSPTLVNIPKQSRD